MKRTISLVLLTCMLSVMLSSCADSSTLPDIPAETMIPAVTEAPAPEITETPAPEETQAPDEDVPGEWDTAETPALTEEVMQIFSKGFGGLLGVRYVPAAYLGSQTIIGKVHTFLTRATVVVPNARETYALVYLYEEPDGNVRIIDICRSDIPTGMDDPSGYEPAEDPVLTDELIQGFEEAVSKKLGVHYVPVALSGTKISSGMEFVIIAEATPVVPDAETCYSFVYMTRSNDGKYAVSDIVEFKVEDNQPAPAVTPSPTPTASPSPSPTASATPSPSPAATDKPTPEPTSMPTETPAATEEPAPVPTQEPTPVPTEEPVPEPTEEPAPDPTEEPEPEPTEEPAPIPTGDAAGSWKKPDSPAIDAKTANLFDRIASSTVGVKYQPIALIGTQQVNGTNFAVLCETAMSAPNSQNLYSIVYLHEDTDGSVKVTDVVFSEVRTYTELTMGGWTTAEDARVTGDTASMFTSAMKTRLGASYSPVALLSTQNASGTNYCFFCEAGKITADPTSEYVFVYINEAADGTVSVYEILDFISD